MSDRIIHNVEQGSPEWLAHRANPKLRNASDAAAALGLSKYTSRRALLDRVSSGVVPEIDAATQRRFDDGHANEAIARQWAEEIVGEELYPSVMTREYEGLLLGASFDGLTMLEDTAWEHKTLNKDLAASLERGEIPREYKYQMEQGLIISGAQRCLFMASNGDKETMLWAWYTPEPGIKTELISGWEMFEIDLANYRHVPEPVATVAAAIEDLPALMVQIEGKVLATNLDAFKEKALTFIANINTDLQTDQQFADADKMTKYLKDGEDRLALVKKQALSQTASIDEIFRTIDNIADQMRSKRLSLEKLVASEKTNRKNELLEKARTEIVAHVHKLNEGFGANWISSAMAAPPFAEAIKGLKSLTSMRDKLDTALLQAKMAADEQARLIDRNRKSLQTGEADWFALFPDFSQVCSKSADDFDNLVTTRVAMHKARIAEELDRARKAEIDQGGKADAGVRQENSSRAQPEAASTPPTQVDDTELIDSYLSLLGCSFTEKRTIREHLVKFMKYRAAKGVRC